jgi:hypothetical protein
MERVVEAGLANRARMSDSRAMRRPSPALIVGMVALFFALGGAGFAAALTLSPVQAVKPTVYFSGRSTGAGPNGQGLKVSNPSTGNYTLTITGQPFKRASAPANMTVTPFAALSKGEIPPPTVCDLTSSQIQANGSVIAGVVCQAYDAGGWKPVNTAFNIAVSGPKGP